jgi:hypothetical protein
MTQPLPDLIQEISPEKVEVTQVEDEAVQLYRENTEMYTWAM